MSADGKREISCGYTYELCEENGQYIQRKIRGNHVAVVDAGRAGARVSIRDKKPREPERRRESMKKSLSKILARMAKDGDIETVAEIIEEMIEPEGAAEAAAAAVAEEVAEAAETIAEDPAAVVETPEGATIVVDESTLADIVSRLDRLIELLTPGPASDENPMEEIAEVVEEAIEAATAGEGGDPSTLALGCRPFSAENCPPDSFPGAPNPGMTEEAIGMTPEVLEPEDVAEIVEEILEPVTMETLSEVLDPLGDECEEEEEQEVLSTGDALRVALKAVRPALARMPRKTRARVCADIAARLRRPAGRRITDAGVYAAIAAKKRRPYRGNPADLGKRIMASRNINCRRG